MGQYDTTLDFKIHIWSGLFFLSPVDMAWLVIIPGSVFCELRTSFVESIFRVSLRVTFSAEFVNLDAILSPLSESFVPLAVVFFMMSDFSNFLFPCAVPLVRTGSSLCNRRVCHYTQSQSFVHLQCTAKINSYQTVFLHLDLKLKPLVVLLSPCSSKVMHTFLHIIKLDFTALSVVLVML